MDKYHITARKYRPQKFADVVGQEAIVKTLTNALSTGRVSHAYLFAGTRGCGKTTLARLFAKAINCLNREGVEPCNACSSCKEIWGGSSLDVIEIDGASNRGIEDIRQINENAGYAASSGGDRIYIIDEVHMLTKEAFNALLKTLEEPPARVKFFLATTEPHKVPATILSRCQRFDLRRIKTAQIAASLKAIAEAEGVAIDKEALSVIAERAEGSLRDSQSLFDQIRCMDASPISAALVREALGLPAASLFTSLDQLLTTGDLHAAEALTLELYERGHDFSAFLEGLALHFIDSARKGTPFSRGQSLDCLGLISRALAEIHKTPFKRVHLDILLAELIALLHKPSLNTLVERLEALKKTPAPVVPPPEPVKENKELSLPKNDYDRLLQFASVELNGTVKK